MIIFYRSKSHTLIVCKSMVMLIRQIAKISIANSLLHFDFVEDMRRMTKELKITLLHFTFTIHFLLQLLLMILEISSKKGFTLFLQITHLSVNQFNDLFLTSHVNY